MRDPHDWNSWDNYLEIHDKRVEEHPFVLENSLSWTFIGDADRPEAIVLEGGLICNRGVVIRVLKALDCRQAHGRLEVRGRLYEYNAHFAGHHNILRYDNSHLDEPNDFHRHLFDLATGQEVDLSHITRAAMPTLAGFVAEVAALVEAG